MSGLILTYTTRLKIPDIADKHYLNNRFKFYSQIEHRLFNQLIKGKIADHKLREEVGHTYGISGRKANSLVRKVRGRINALRELKALEYENIQIRSSGIQEAITKLSDKLFNLKLRASRNSLTEEKLKELRYLKRKKHRLCLKLNKLTQQIKDFDKRSESMCFGSKRLFKAQFYLDENGYATHNDWLRDWRKARSNSWYFVGAADETNGNQNCQYDIESGVLRVRKDTATREYLVFNDVWFKYGSHTIMKAIGNRQPLTFTIKRKKQKYYLYVSVEYPKILAKPVVNGTIGLDYNNGFIQRCNVTHDGNIKGFRRYPLPAKGVKAVSEVELRTTIKSIVDDASLTQNSISVENLDFRKKKAKTSKSVNKNKRYQKMINSFDYARYIDYLSSECHKIGVKLIKVNPYKTTKIGKKKYGRAKGLNSHQAASYVIGRKGLGFSE